MSKYLCGECIHNSDKGGGCLIPKNLGYVDNCNQYLPKDRPIVQTNEEWLHTLNTEEKAFALETIIRSVLVQRPPMCHDVCNREFWERWLKEKHE